MGNFRYSYVARLALMGYHGVQEYLEAPARERERRPPAGCTVDPDTRVRRIWERELRALLGRGGRREALRRLYRELRENVGRSPSVMDFFANPEAHDPMAFIREFGGWLRAKEAMEDLAPFERELLGTPGEAFLLHLERQLHPQASYKMVVLAFLLESGPERVEWTVEEIARGFKRYYLEHPEHRADYGDMAGAPDPTAFPLTRVAAKLREMPLHFLSNTEADFFVLDRETDRFRLKDEVAPYWGRAEFRGMTEDRITYALKRYFHRKAAGGRSH